MLETQLRKKFNTGNFQIGASALKRYLWFYCNIIFFKSQLIPFSSVLVLILRAFGAKIGKEVRIKPGIYIKYPWKLTIGDYSWLADCYIENLDWVHIGENCCLSQKATLITGNHDYTKTSFDLRINQIILENGVWLGANTTIAPGVIAHTHAVLSLGSVATKSLEAYSTYQGNPAQLVRKRIII